VKRSGKRLTTSSAATVTPLPPFMGGAAFFLLCPGGATASRLGGGESVGALAVCHRERNREIAILTLVENFCITWFTYTL
jgi:hypothetical protein